LSLLLSVLSAIALADNFQILPDRASQNPTDIIDWTQLGPSTLVTGSTISSPQVVTTFNGNPVLVGNMNGGDFLRLDEGFGWLGNFDFGESLVWTGNPNIIGGAVRSQCTLHFQGRRLDSIFKPTCSARLLPAWRFSIRLSIR
jgi:hypothetical protein